MLVIKLEIDIGGLLVDEWWVSKDGLGKFSSGKLGVNFHFG